MNETLERLVTLTLHDLSNKGYADESIAVHRRLYAKLDAFCAANGFTSYDESVRDAFIDNYVSTSYPQDAKKITNIRRYLKRLDCTLHNIEWSPERDGRRPIPYVQSRFNCELTSYERYLNGSGRTEKDIRSRLHIVAWFLKFEDDRGIVNLSDISAEDIYAAFGAATDKGRFRRLVGHFLTYGFKNGLFTTNLCLLIPKVVRHKAIPSVYSTEEVERLLLSVNRETKTGKRDYAIILIAARLGLRASDIAALTFDSINENSATIKVTQQKTKTSLTLPLLDEISEALHDYIDNARPSQDDCHIFMKVRGNGHLKPFHIGRIVELAFTASDIECGNRRKGSHSLRASLATALLDEGHGYYTIQQVMGHSNIQSIKAYVKVNAEHLRDNALPVPKPSGNFMNLLSNGGAA